MQLQSDSPMSREDNNRMNLKPAASPPVPDSRQCAVIFIGAAKTNSVEQLNWRIACNSSYEMQPSQATQTGAKHERKQPSSKEKTGASQEAWRGCKKRNSSMQLPVHLPIHSSSSHDHNFFRQNQVTWNSGIMRPSRELLWLSCGPTTTKNHLPRLHFSNLSCKPSYQMTTTLQSYIPTMVDEDPHLIWSLRSLFGSGCSQWSFLVDLVPQEYFWFMVFPVIVPWWGTTIGNAMSQKGSNYYDHEHWVEVVG